MELPSLKVPALGAAAQVQPALAKPRSKFLANLIYEPGLD